MKFTVEGAENDKNSGMFISHFAVETKVLLIFTESSVNVLLLKKCSEALSRNLLKPLFSGQTHPILVHFPSSIK